jgi:hypothetical protein
MELTFDQSLFVRKSAINIQSCSREELEDLFIQMLKLKLLQENTFQFLIKQEMRSRFDPEPIVL